MPIDLHHPIETSFAPFVGVRPLAMARDQARARLNFESRTCTPSDPARVKGGMHLFTPANLAAIETNLALLFVGVLLVLTSRAAQGSSSTSPSSGTSTARFSSTPGGRSPACSPTAKRTTGPRTWREHLRGSTPWHGGPQPPGRERGEPRLYLGVCRSPAPHRRRRALRIDADDREDQVLLGRLNRRGWLRSVFQFSLCGSEGGTRTPDPAVNSRLLYRLSYFGMVFGRE
jgi:hypothetical protein